MLKRRLEYILFDSLWGLILTLITPPLYLLAVAVYLEWGP